MPKMPKMRIGAGRQNKEKMPTMTKAKMPKMAKMLTMPKRRRCQRCRRCQDAKDAKEAKMPGAAIVISTEKGEGFGEELRPTKLTGCTRITELEKEIFENDATLKKKENMTSMCDES